MKTMHVIKRYLISRKLSLPSSSIFVFFYFLQIFPVSGQFDKVDGKFIGDFITSQHEVSGKVYALANDRILIKDFTYDGEGPDTFFWTAMEGEPNTMGVLIPYPPDEQIPKKLRAFNKEEITVTLPSGQNLKNLAYIAVWCRQATMNFGHVIIPKGFTPPQAHPLPGFPTYAHGLKSDSITILDSKTFDIRNLHYDGAGPAAYFWVGKGTPDLKGKAIPDENGNTGKLKGYKGANIKIALPEGTTVYDIDYLSMYCVAATQNFGHVLIPKDIEVPPAPKPDNCLEFLGGSVVLKWEKEGSSAKFQLSGKMTEKQWVAVGFNDPDANGRPQMVGADAIVAYYTPTTKNKFHADDYFLEAKSQCNSKQGACPDTTFGGNGNVEVISGYRKNDFTRVSFRRPIQVSAGEEKWDKPLDGDVHVFVAIGGLNSDLQVNTHHQQRTTTDFTINLEDKNKNKCSYSASLSEKSKLAPWKLQKIKGVTEFKVKIGQAGGDRGYKGITTLTWGWGIAFYVNDLIIPIIQIEKGKTYNFVIETGNNASDSANYHPFYITDSIRGGYFKRSIEERKKEKIFAGLDKDNKPYPATLGRYCEYKNKGEDKYASIDSFEEYFKTLRLNCQDGQPGHLSWKVPNDVPETVYYQCYTHEGLGWKLTTANIDASARILSASASPIIIISFLITCSTFPCFEL